jgi:hypothetical protein
MEPFGRVSAAGTSQASGRMHAQNFSGDAGGHFDHRGGM